MKKLFEDFVNAIETPTIERRQLLEFFSGKADLAKVDEIIKEHFEISVISNGPTVYNTIKFEECISKLEAPPIKVIRDLHEADGRRDPNQPDIIKTKSYNDLEELMSEVYPLNIYIAGETGLGKSTAVFGIAKRLEKPVIRVNMSIATDIDDLIGGIRIIDGNTVFDPGPVAIAMELGAILLLDEVDAGNPKILIDLHPVLERKGVLAKKARKMLYPTHGFCVIATGNSKGTGDATGKYIGVNNMNHAFLERFGAALEFQPPSKSEMCQILAAALPKLPKLVLNNLCNWYDHVLNCFESGSVTEYIHPRKMLDIGTLCLIFGAKTGIDSATSKAIRRSLGLKEAAVIESLTQLYETIATDLDDPRLTEISNEPLNLDENGIKIPF